MSAITYKQKVTTLDGSRTDKIYKISIDLDQLEKMTGHVKIIGYKRPEAIKLTMVMNSLLAKASCLHLEHLTASKETLAPFISIREMSMNQIRVPAPLGLPSTITKLSLFALKIDSEVIAPQHLFELDIQCTDMQKLLFPSPCQLSILRLSSCTYSQTFWETLLAQFSKLTSLTLVNCAVKKELVPLASLPNGREYFPLESLPELVKLTICYTCYDENEEPPLSFDSNLKMLTLRELRWEGPSKFIPDFYWHQINVDVIKINQSNTSTFSINALRELSRRGLI